jgi:hypothetical protein
VPESKQSLAVLKGDLDFWVEYLLSEDNTYSTVDEFFAFLEAHMDLKMMRVRRHFKSYVEELRPRIPTRNLEGPKILFEQLPARA